MHAVYSGTSMLTDPLILLSFFGQPGMRAPMIGIDQHPSVQYIEQHVVGLALIEWTHTAFVMFPLKLVVLFRESTLWRLIS